MITLLILLVFLVVGGSLYAYIRNKKKAVEKTFVKIMPVLHQRNTLLPPLEDLIKPHLEDESKILHDVIEMEEDVEKNTVVSDFISEEAEMEMEKEFKKNRTTKNPKKLSMNERILMENDLTEYIDRIISMTESLDSLNADSRFSDLKDEFEECTKEFMKAREVFNKRVIEYNDAVKTFPSSLLAAIFRFKPIITLSGQEWNHASSNDTSSTKTA